MLSNLAVVVTGQNSHAMFFFLISTNHVLRKLKRPSCNTVEYNYASDKNLSEM